MSKEDRVSMAHSLEARTPLCDNDVLDLALTVPLGTKLSGNNLKAISKSAMRDHLPSELYQLPKRGFPTPFARWYRAAPLREFMRDLLFDKRTRERGLLNPRAVQRLFEANERSSTDFLYDYARANKLWSIAAVELWCRTFLDAKEPAPVC